METLIQSMVIPSAPPPSYDEAMDQSTAPSRSLEQALIELGQTSENEHIKRIAQNHITPKQPNLDLATNLLINLITSFGLFKISSKTMYFFQSKLK